MPALTVRGWRYRRRDSGERPGPRYIRVEGRVRYRRGDVREYLERMTSTDEAAQ